MARRGRVQKERGEPRKDPLEKRSEDLERIREFVDETTFAGGEDEAIDELSGYDQNNDVGDFTFQRELDHTVRRIVDIEESQIRHARERRAQGKYGICEVCGRRIPRERLKARPEATTCVDCQRRLESRWGE